MAMTLEFTQTHWCPAEFMASNDAYLITFRTTYDVSTHEAAASKQAAIDLIDEYLESKNFGEPVIQEIPPVKVTGHTRYRFFVPRPVFEE